MFTVKELIEALKKCPEDYEVLVNAQEGFSGIEQIGIDNEEKTVDLFIDI